jgi:hypothetical protein
VIGTAVAVAVHFHAIIAAEVIVKPVDHAYVLAPPAVADTVLCIHTLMLAPAAALRAVIFC